MAKFDVTKPAHRALVLSEITVDPDAVGYDLLGNTQPIVDRLNLAEHNPISADQVNIPFDELMSYEVMDDIVQAEYNVLSALKQVKINAMIAAAYALPAQSFLYLKVQFKAIFGANSDTWAAVQLDRTRQASRMEKLFARDDTISSAQLNSIRNEEV